MRQRKYKSERSPLLPYLTGVGQSRAHAVACRHDLWHGSGTAEVGQDDPQAPHTRLNHHDRREVHEAHYTLVKITSYIEGEESVCEGVCVFALPVSHEIC